MEKRYWKYGEDARWRNALEKCYWKRGGDARWRNALEKTDEGLF